ncbi:DHA2 family efflux MFS transporter permease subunit [Phenylobacterium sp. LjRoot219]|uniref:DHA2 family efflux MFS transporter permease subunit n=1 Tax=Phenylobacterium sp. LjRoot219 TaxID=3342283 RepID=UPI003ECE95D4
MNQPGPSAEPLTGLRLLGAAVLLSLANFMVVLDTTIANVSVPHIAGGLAVSPSQGTWVITSYAVAEAITVPLTGWLVQRFGGVKVFMVSMVGFGIFSLACGLAPSFGALVFFRVLQGLCGGPIMPTSQTLLLQIFPKEKSAQALGIWSITLVVGPIAGPLLGGMISDTIGWHWIFFINIPVAIGIVIAAWAMLRAHDNPTRRVPVDYVGLLLLIVWVGAFQIMLDKGKELEWFESSTIVGLAIVAAIGFACFLIWELTSENPIVDLRIFRHRGFTAGVLTLSLVFGTFFSTVVLIPLWLQTSLGYTATWAGYASAFNGVLAVMMSPFVAKMLGAKVDPRRLVTFGIIGLSLVSLWRGHFTTDVTFWGIAAPFLVQGFFLPFFMVPITALTLSSVRPEETASAAGLSNFLRTCAGAFATSIMTTTWENTATEKRGLLVGHLNDVPGTVQALGDRGVPAEQARGLIDQLVQVQATMLATNHLFLMATVLFLLAGTVVWLAPRPKGGMQMGGGH